MKITLSKENLERDPLLQKRHELLELLIRKEINGLYDVEQFAYLQGIREIERQLESLNYAGPQVDVALYAELKFRLDDEQFALYESSEQQ